MRKLLLAAAVAFTFVGCFYNFDDDYDQCVETGWCGADAGTGGGGGGDAGSEEDAGGGGGSTGGLLLVEPPSLVGSATLGGSLTLDGGVWADDSGVPFFVDVELERCAGLDASICVTLGTFASPFSPKDIDLDGRFRAVAIVTGTDGGRLATAASPMSDVIVRTAPANLVTFSGFETGDFHSADGVGTGTAISSSSRTGGFALRLDGTGRGALFTPPGLGTAGYIAGRFALRVVALPNAIVNLQSFGFGQSSAAFLNLSPGGKLFPGTIVNEPAAPQLSLGVWNVVEYRLVKSGGSAWELIWRLNGLEQPSVFLNLAAVDGGLQPGALVVGMTPSSFSGLDAYLDDFAVSFSDYPIGDGNTYAQRVRSVLRINGNGAFTCIGSSANCQSHDIGSNAAAQVESAAALGKWPADLTDSIVMASGNSASFIEYSLSAPVFTPGPINGVALTHGYGANFAEQLTAVLHSDAGAADFVIDDSVSDNVIHFTRQYRSRTASGTPWAFEDVSGMSFMWGFAGSAVNSQPKLYEVLVEVDVPARR